MIIDGKEYNQKLHIKHKDHQLGLEILRFDSCKFYNRLLSDLEYNAEKREFEDIIFAINYNAQDEIVNFVFRYYFEKFIKENKERLLEKFLYKEYENFCNMNIEKIEVEIFNEDTVKVIDEVEENKEKIESEELK